MRISDWSSDVCSSDLPDRDESHHALTMLVEYGHAAAVTAHFGAAARRALVEDLGFTGQRVARIDRLEPAQFVDPRRTQPGLSVGFQILDHHRHRHRAGVPRSEEHTSELHSLMRISYAVFCLKNNTKI